MQRVNFNQTIYNDLFRSPPYNNTFAYDPIAFFGRYRIPYWSEREIVDSFLNVLYQNTHTADDRKTALEFIDTKTNGAPGLSLGTTYIIGDVSEWIDRTTHFWAYIASLPQGIQK